MSTIYYVETAADGRTVVRRDWDSLSKHESGEIFDEHVSSHDERVREAVDALVPIVGRDVLDFSPDSLNVIWPAIVSHVAALPAEPEDLRGWPVPYWVPFRPLFAAMLGFEVTWIVSHLAAYFAEVALCNHEGVRWELGDVKNQQGYRQPLLVFGNGGRMTVEDNMANMVKQALAGKVPIAEQDRQPDALRATFDLRVNGMLAAAVEGPSGGSRFDAQRLGDGTFHVVSTVDVDDELDGRLDALVDALGADERVVSAHREDREVLIVDAPQLSQEQLIDVLDEMIHRM